MPVIDLTGVALESYRSEVQPPDDLDEFWRRTLEESRSSSSDPELTPAENGLALVDTWDLTFGGFLGQPVRAWYHRPAPAAEDLPVVVHFQGYGGGRGLPHEVRRWVMAGYGALEVDSRGQGGTWRSGDTADPVGTGPSQVGYLTQGILDPHDHYYRRLLSDAARAAEIAKTLPGSDGRVVVAGDSQGGGMSIAAAGLVDGLTGAMPSVPFLCDLPRAVDLAPEGPYLEVERYLRVNRDHADQVWRTLSYVDGVVLAPRATCPALFAVGGRDLVCPPSTGYAAYQAWAGPKAMCLYPYNGHEGGEGFHEARQLAWLAELLS